jgi:P27 family predicted phage terminase small subunit
MTPPKTPRKPPATKAPRHLDRDGAALWRDLTAEYSIHDAGGQALLVSACEALDRMRQAQEAIAADGAVIKDRYGCPKAHPACNLERDARNGFLAAMRALHLDVEPPKPVGRPAGSWGNGR